MGMHIRGANLSDLPVLKEKYAALYCILDQYSFPFILNEEILEDILKAQIVSKLCNVLLVEHDGEVCGFMVATISRLERKFFSQKGKLIGFVQDIFVDEKYRGYGYADALLGVAEEWFSQNDVQMIQGCVSLQNRQSGRFFEKHGYGFVFQTFYKELPGETSDAEQSGKTD